MTGRILEALALIAFMTLLTVLAGMKPQAAGDPRSPDFHLADRSH